MKFESQFDVSADGEEYIFIAKAPTIRIIMATIAVVTSMMANMLLHNIFDF